MSTIARFLIKTAALVAILASFLTTGCPSSPGATPEINWSEPSPPAPEIAPAPEFTATPAIERGLGAGQKEPPPETGIPKLSDDDKELAKEIALNDHRVQEILAGKQYTVEVGLMHSGSEKTGGAVRIGFAEVYWVEFDWPGFDPFEMKETTWHARLPLREMVVEASFVEDPRRGLRENKVYAILPMPASGFTPQLTAAEKAQAERIALNDTRIKELLQDRKYAVREITAVGYEKEYASVDLRFDEPPWIESDWPWRPYLLLRQLPADVEFTWRRAFHVSRVFVYIDLKEEKVKDFSVGGAGDDELKLTGEELSRAREAALNDPRVQAHLKGKPYSLSGRVMWYSREPPVTHPYLDIRFVPEPDFPPPVVEQEWLFHKGGQEVTHRARVIGLYGIYVEIDPAVSRVITMLPYFYD